jgi:hypothetical protein
MVAISVCSTGVARTFCQEQKKKKENRRGTQRHAKSNQCLQQTIYFRPYSATAMSPVSLMTSLLPLCS